MTTPADRLRSLGHRLVDRLADHLDHVGAGAEAVLVPGDPDALAASLGELAADPAADPGATLDELVDLTLAWSNRIHHPAYMGHQVAPSLPEGAVVELLVALLNNGMAIREMGQLQTAAEERVVAWLCERVGFGAGAGGLLCHGGSLGNLTALLAARRAKLGAASWSDGLVGAGEERRPALLVSEQAHYCVARAAGVMGWGSAGAVPVATDAAFRLDPADLPRALERARDAGREPLAVVASSCTTAVGAFDPLPAIADFCADHDLWLHVDGAHGASQVLSARHAAPLAGLERVDSLAWDLHKLAGLPALNTAVLFRDARHAEASFQQDASYLFEDDAAAVSGAGAPGTTGAAPAAQGTSHDLGKRTLECTKRGMGLVAWVTLRLFGTDAFAARIDRQVDNGRALYERLAAAPDFEPAHEPETNILCFRHRPDGVAPGPELDAHQARLRRAVVDGGSHYLGTTELRGATWLRVALMNPATGQAELEGLLDVLRAAAS